MAFLRAFAWFLLLVAVIVLTNDLTRAAGGVGGFMVSSLSHWKETSPGSLATASTFVQKSLHPTLWDPVMVRVLILPAWILLGSLGLLLAVLGRRKRRVNIFAN